MKAFVDTTVLVYQYDHADVSKRDRAREVLAGDIHLTISTQVLLELHAVLTRKLGYSAENAAAALRGIDLPVLAADDILVHAAASTAAEHQLAIWDAMIIEAAARGGCDELWTEDLTDQQTLRGVRIVNPFAGLQPAA